MSDCVIEFSEIYGAISYYLEGVALGNEPMFFVKTIRHGDSTLDCDVFNLFKSLNPEDVRREITVYLVGTLQLTEAESWSKKSRFVSARGRTISLTFDLGQDEVVREFDRLVWVFDTEPNPECDLCDGEGCDRCYTCPFCNNVGCSACEDLPLSVSDFDEFDS
jgi:hypothetical protein